EIGDLRERRKLGAGRADQLGEDPAPFRLLVLDRLLELVVRLDRLERLEVVALARRRAAVDQAAGAPLGAGLEDQHEPAAAQRDRLFGQLLFVLLDEAAELLVEAAADPPDLLA